MTFEVGIDHLVSFFIGILVLWIKNYVGSSAKEEGKIEARVEMLPELRKIESILTGAKIEGQLAKINKLEEIAEAQARGQYSAEFEYYIMKEDSNKLAEFTEKVMKYSSRLQDLIDNSNKEKLEMYREYCKSGLKDQELDFMQAESKENTDQWIRETKIIYILYFSKYKNSELNEAFKRWVDSNIYRIENYVNHCVNFNNTIDKEISPHDKKLELENVLDKSFSDSIKFHDNGMKASQYLLSKIEVFAGEIVKTK